MSFEEFYNLSFSKVYKFYYYKFVPKDYIEDLAQESFIRFFRKYEPWLEKRPNDCPKILLGICRNIYKEWVREQIKEKEVPFIENYEYELSDDSVSDDDLLFESKSPEQVLFKDIDKVKETLKTLNQTVRKVLEYRFLEGKTRKETAELLGIKEKDVHTYQKRGIKYLKKIMDTG